MSTRINRPKTKSAPPRTNNRVALFVTGAALLGGVAIAIWAAGNALIPDKTSTSVKQIEESRPQAEPKETQVASTEPEKKLFSESMLTAEEQAPQEPADQAEPENAGEEENLPFKLDQVAYALSRVELDENGDVVMNEEAQTLLEQAFMDARETINEEQLAELKTMIEAGLGGQAGEEAARIADKFYRYSNAYREISDTLAIRGDPRSLQNDYDQIARLRRAHLGPELAEKLYAREEQMTRYTIDLMAIQADKNLTPEQRAEKRQELAARYPDVLPNGDTEDPDQSGEQVTN